jgi:hypothetical protein
MPELRCHTTDMQGQRIRDEAATAPFQRPLKMGDSCICKAWRDAASGRFTTARIKINA